MYLTQITIDVLEIQKHKLFDNYRWKQELCKSLPPPAHPDEERSFLFKTTDKGKKGIVAMVLSREYPKILPFGKWNIHKIAENFYQQRKYFFDLIANPTKRKFEKPIDENGNKKKQGQRVGLHSDVHEQWIKKQLEKVGCELLKKEDIESEDNESEYCLSIDSYGMQICSHKDGKNREHLAVKFCGVLEVKNPEILQKAVFSGIGTGRAFGFGLLLLKPI